MSDVQIPWTFCKDSLPDHDCECLVLTSEPISIFEVCNYSKKSKKFLYWDYYNDTMGSYKISDIKAWVELKKF